MLSFQELLKNLKYFGIHNHSESSNQRLGDSTNKIPKLVQYGEQIGLKGIALTDHESLSGHVEAMDIGQQLLDKGSEFKLALGNEIYLVNSLEEVRDNYQGGGLTKFPHLILVAKNKQGHRALRELSTLAWMSSYKTGQMVRVPTTKENFARVLMKPEYKNSVIVSSACLGCEIALEFNKYKNGDSKALERIDKFISACQTVVGKNNYYLEIQPSYMQEQIEYNKFIINYGRTHNIKVIFSTDTHYLTKDHREIHKAYLNSKEGDREVDDFYASTYMMSTEEIWEYFKDYISEEDFIQMCNNSVEIYNEIEYFNLFHPTIVPQINVPPFNTYCELGEMGKEYEYINKYYTSKHLIDKYLVFKINEGMKKLNKPFTNTYLERINEEMGYIWEISEKLESRLSSYYLLTQEVIDLCWLVSLVGIARGSATGFLLCYLLQITQMNPLEYNLPAWRHIHHSRPELPDIDFDLQPEKREEIFNMCKEKYGHNKCLNILTVKTLSPKACLQVVGRGLGMNNDLVMGISDMIPTERGQTWSFADCLEGNEEKERKPIPQFLKIKEQYPKLIEYALELEGLKTSISSHASGFIIFDSDFIELNSLMRTPGGTNVTCWTMTESERCGALKLDFLVTDAMSKIRATMEMLLEKGIIENRGSLRDNYNYYLHPDVLDYKNQDMYDMIFKGELTEAFQFQTSLGKQVLKKLNARSIGELTVGNSLMRLAVKHGEQPLDKYIRYKSNPGLWDKEMRDFGLNEQEISILKDNLDECYGVMDVQERLMIICMDSRVSNFTMAEANKIRKAIAKKKPKLIEESKQMFYKKGLENGCRQIFLDYIWDIEITPQLGYSFSMNHTAPYSGIMLQEANLAYNYGTIYWKAGVLKVNSQSDTDHTVDYAKVAKAVAEQKDIVVLPNINLSQKGFDVVDDKILYGLKPITKVSEDEIEQIIKNRPYKSFEDFTKKCSISKSGMINLIKSGCFDSLESNREQLLRNYIETISETKTKLTLSNINDLVTHRIVEEKEFERELLYINTYKYVCSKSNLVEIEELKGQWYSLDSNIESNFLDLYSDLQIDKDYIYNGYGFIVKKSSVEKIRKNNTQNIIKLLNSKETLNSLNKAIVESNMNTYAYGDRPKWEMDSIYFYYTGHELDSVNNDKYGIVDFNDLPDSPIIVDKGVSKRGYEWKKYQTNLIAGTVLDANKTNHFIVIQTPSEVVGVRMTKGAFDWYNKNISEIQSDGKKKVIDGSWFKRGTKLILQGYRNEDNEFVLKKYNDSVLEHTIVKILDIEDNGDLQVQLERKEN